MSRCRRRPSIRRRPVADGLEELASILTTSRRPGSPSSSATRLRRRTRWPRSPPWPRPSAAPVFGSPLHGNAVFAPTHPLWHGMLAPAAAAINATLRDYDHVFLVGGRAFMVYPYTPGPALPAVDELLHLSPDPYQLGRAYPTRSGRRGRSEGVVGHAPAADRGARGQTRRAETVVALAAAAGRRQAEIERLESSALARYGSSPIDPMAAAHALVRAMPPRSLVVDEAITTGVYVRGFHHEPVPGRYFFCPGGGLGWGMPAACGVSLGHGGEPVLCVVGDGSAMYSPQALWTAAHEQLPVVFAVVNNREYRILKNNLRGMSGDSVRLDRYVAMDIDATAGRLRRAGGLDGRRRNAGREGRRHRRRGRARPRHRAPASPRGPHRGRLGRTRGRNGTAGFPATPHRSAPGFFR